MYTWRWIFERYLGTLTQRYQQNGDMAHESLHYVSNLPCNFNPVNLPRHVKK